MIKLFQSLQIALSFFTILPVFKHYEWTRDRMRFIPIMLPVIGAIIGVIYYSLFNLIQLTSLSLFSVSFLGVMLQLVITGGLHHDGLMDVADAVFSRSSSIVRRVEIMKDSRVGAFAVMTMVMYTGIFWIVLYEVIGDVNPTVFVIIPVLSRVIMALMFYHFPAGSKKGMAAMFKEAIVYSDRFVLYVFLVLVSIVLYLYIGIKALLLVVIAILFLVGYKGFIIRNFGGMSGDLFGSFVLILELLLWIGIGVVD